MSPHVETCGDMTTPAPEPDHPVVGMRELSQRTAKVIAHTREGKTVEVTDRGETIAYIVPASNSRYAQLVARGVIRMSKRPFAVSHLPEPVAETSGRTTGELLEELRGEH